MSLVTGVEPAQPIPLRAALEKLRLDGAIFFRAEFTESWAFESPLTEITELLWANDRFYKSSVSHSWISTFALCKFTPPSSRSMSSTSAVDPASKFVGLGQRAQSRARAESLPATGDRSR